MKGMDKYEDTALLKNEDTAQYEDDMEDSSNSVKGIAGTLGSAILILVMVTVLAYVMWQRRIKVYKYKYKT